MNPADMERATQALMKGQPRLMRRLLWPTFKGTRRTRKLASQAKLRRLREALCTIVPDFEELALLSQLGRVGRLVQSGASPIDAALKFLEPEDPESYAERNAAAMEALEARILSPEYMDRFAKIWSEPDPIKRAELSAALKRENYATVDMEAVHRSIRARNRQFVMEGVLPPTAKI